MKCFDSSSSNDFVIGDDGSLRIVSDRDAVAVVARHHMQTRRGEMIHDIQSGIPFDVVAWADAPNIAQFEAVGRRRLMQVDNVREVAQFNASVSGDTLSYTALIATGDFGEVEING